MTEQEASVGLVQAADAAVAEARALSSSRDAHPADKAMVWRVAVNACLRADLKDAASLGRIEARRHERIARWMRRPAVQRRTRRIVKTPTGCACAECLAYAKRLLERR